MAKKQEKESYAQTKAAQETAGQRAGQAFDPAVSGYTNFAKTGGVTPEEENLARRQTSYGISSLYDAGKRSLAQRNRIQGGYSPGYGANLNQLNRNRSEEIAKGLTGTNLGLLGLKRQGQLAGLGGLSNLYGTSSGQQGNLLGLQSQDAFKLKSGLGRAAGVVGDITGMVGDIGSTIGGFMYPGMGRVPMPQTDDNGPIGW